MIAWLLAHAAYVALAGSLFFAADQGIHVAQDGYNLVKEVKQDAKQ